MSIVDLRGRVRAMVDLLVEEDWFKNWAWRGDDHLLGGVPTEYVLALLGAIPHQKDLDARYRADQGRIHLSLSTNRRFAAATGQKTEVWPDTVPLPYVDPDYPAYPILHRGPQGYNMRLMEFVLDRAASKTGKPPPDALLATAPEKEVVACFMRVRDWMTRNGVPVEMEGAKHILVEAYIYIASARLAQVQLSASLRAISSDMMANGIKDWQLWGQFARLDVPYFAPALPPTAVRGGGIAILAGENEWLVYLYDQFMRINAQRVAFLQASIAEAEQMCARDTPVPGPALDEILGRVTESAAITMVLHPDYGAESDIPTSEVERPKTK